MRARLRRLLVIAWRPVGAALDRRFDRVSDRLLGRMEQLENHVAVDAEASAEMVITHGRSLMEMEARLARIEARLDALAAEREVR